MVEGEIVDVGARVPLLIRARHVDVVHVQQQTAPGSPGDLPDEIRLAPCALLEPDVGRGVLQQHLPGHSCLHLVDVLADAVQRVVGVRHRQQIIEVAGAM
ncbi:hypothetical protein G6F23_015557 [Rhizopus arrhizus]|nr:hypothetical protein G6F23_015557 [Rhizopus arrhizus]